MTLIAPCSIVNESSDYYGRRGLYCGPSATFPGMVRVIIFGSHPSQDVSLAFMRSEIVIEHEVAA